MFNWLKRLLGFVAIEPGTCTCVFEIKPGGVIEVDQVEPPVCAKCHKIIEFWGVKQ